MLAYQATKGQFLQDAPDIEEIVREQVAAKLGIRIDAKGSEYQSWRNSLGNAMFHIMNSAEIPNNAGVAIEYRLHNRGQRIDFMVSGNDDNGQSQLLIVELKQWSEIAFSPLDDHVRTVFRGGMQDVRHPSYQAWSYGRLLNDFYEYVTSDPIHVKTTAYLHNCTTGTVIKDGRFSDLMSKSPIFLSSDRIALQQYIAKCIRTGDNGEIIKRVDASPVRVSKQLVDALESMLNGNPEFVLIDDQKTAFESIRSAIRELKPGQKNSILVKGGPGTGKSVIAINALVDLLRQDLNTRYVTKNAAPRAVFQTQLRGKRTDVATNNLFVSSDSFVESKRDEYDVLLVDEAHRLAKHSGFYANLGENQIAEAINAARTTVFFADESQLVTWRDIGTLENIRSAAADAGSQIQEFELTAQFRCAGSTDYLNWLDTTLGLASVPEAVMTDSEYQFQIFTNPADLRDWIFEKNKLNNKSRLLAGYCWDWVSKKDPTKKDIEFPESDFSMKWNLEEDAAWIIAPKSVNEVGCIHTCQGLEGDFMGVIIGDDLQVVDGGLQGNPFNRAKTDMSLKGFKKAFKADPEDSLARADRLIRNTYRTLLTRGMLGTGIYCVDPKVSEFFQNRT